MELSTLSESNPEPKVFSTTWRNKFLTFEAKTIGDMVLLLRKAADNLQAMQTAGIALADDSCVQDDYAHLITTNPLVAQQFGLEEEIEDEEENANGKDYLGPRPNFAMENPAS